MRYCTSFVFALLPLMYLSRWRKPAVATAASGAVDCAELSLPPALDGVMELGMRLDEVLIAAGVSLPAGGSLLIVAQRER